MPILQKHFACGCNCNVGIVYSPSLHVSLPVLLRRRVVELQGSQTHPAHEEESDVLDLFDVALRRVLQERASGCYKGVRINGGTYVEDLEDLLITSDCEEKHLVFVS